ncbi:hypothetical protein GTY65_02830 [Streptomyces sp. SID8379]|uniref:hypothetical protein n=1 Tax=unclassified Streptomyces TaxID=2593676 RepID=UPI0003705A83|nr:MULTISPECIES: hypothetical protein [unclassified Streptomyces]MYW63017.1 hypothetical protein [Streptomyces sp. SID8379]
MTLPHDDHEVRAHLVRSPGGYTVREGGWAVADDEPLTTTASGGPSATVTNRQGLTARVIGLRGYDAADVCTYKDANAVGPCSATPALTAVARAGETVLVGLHALARATAPGGDLPTRLPEAPVVTVSGTLVTVTWPDCGEQSVNLSTFCPWDGQIPGE